jgi:hypothetical protein
MVPWCRQVACWELPARHARAEANMNFFRSAVWCNWDVAVEVCGILKPMRSFGMDWLKRTSAGPGRLKCNSNWLILLGKGHGIVLGMFWWDWTDWTPLITNYAANPSRPASTTIQWEGPAAPNINIPHCMSWDYLTAAFWNFFRLFKRVAVDELEP